jgi:hypothetical protein
MTMDTLHNAILASLSAHWGAWCAAQGLPCLSADEMPLEMMTDAQRTHTGRFIEAWEAVQRIA